MSILHVKDYKLMAVAAILLIAFLIAFHSGCTGSPTEPDPEQPYFYINSLVFTGDSTGEEDNRIRGLNRSQICREETKGEPYCEVTISWTPPEIDSVIIYAVFRSTEPGIESGSTSEDIVGTTTDSIFTDSNSLEWGTTYYYAVSCLTTDSTLFWSNEDSIGMPNSQFPTPSILTAEDLPLGRCILSWTECPDDDFSCYTLIRSRWESGLNQDTLGVFSEIHETTYTDSMLPPYSPRYYRIITTDTQGLSAESDMLEYISGYGLPWFVGFCSNTISYMPVGGLISSPNEDFIYFIVEHISGWEYLYRVSTNNGYHIYSDGAAASWNYVFAPQQNCLLVSRNSSSGYCYIELRNGSTLEIIDQLELPFGTDGLLALPTGGKAIIQPTVGFSIVLDISSMELVDTLDYGFSYGQVIEGYGTYIMGLGPLRRLDPVTLQITATGTVYPDDFTELMVSSNGVLCLILDTYLYELDPYSLSVLDCTPLPMDSYDNGSLIEAQGKVYAYIFKPYFGPSITVYNTETLELIGQVSYLPDYSYEWAPDMITLHSRKEIWCRFFDIFAPNSIGVFNISL